MWWWWRSELGTPSHGSSSARSDDGGPRGWHLQMHSSGRRHADREWRNRVSSYSCNTRLFVLSKCSSLHCLVPQSWGQRRKRGRTGTACAAQRATDPRGGLRCQWRAAAATTATRQAARHVRPQPQAQEQRGTRQATLDVPTAPAGAAPHPSGAPPTSELREVLLGIQVLTWLMPRRSTKAAKAR